MAFTVLPFGLLLRIPHLLLAIQAVRTARGKKLGSAASAGTSNPPFIESNAALLVTA